MALGEGGQEFCEDSTDAIVLKSVTMGVKNCVTSFMDDSYGIWKLTYLSCWSNTGQISPSVVNICHICRPSSESNFGNRDRRIGWNPWWSQLEQDWILLDELIYNFKIWLVMVKAKSCVFWKNVNSFFSATDLLSFASWEGLFRGLWSGICPRFFETGSYIYLWT